jgi:hypothetical protein
LHTVEEVVISQLITNQSFIHLTPVNSLSAVEDATGYAKDAVDIKARHAQQTCHEHVCSHSRYHLIDTTSWL